MPQTSSKSSADGSLHEEVELAQQLEAEKTTNVRWSVRVKEAEEDKERGATWADYSDDINKQLEAAFQEQKASHVVVNYKDGHPYVIWFEMMVQLNLGTYQGRPVRRVIATTSPGSSTRPSTELAP